MRHNHADKILLVNDIANDLVNPALSLICLNAGHPTYPFPTEVARQIAEHWLRLSNPDASKPIGYGNFQGGEAEVKKRIAGIFSKQYGFAIHPENILMTVGGIGGLAAALSACHDPNSVLVTTNPYYPHHRPKSGLFYTKKLTDEFDYQIQANFVEAMLDEATQYAAQENSWVSTLILCDPHNPLGTSFDSREEVSKIIEVLKKYPKLFVILDEVYAELDFNNERFSLLSAADLSLKKRLIVIRSGTKAFSASGERAAASLVFDPTIRLKMINTMITTIGHVPITTQLICCYGLAYLQNKPDYLIRLKAHYQSKVAFVYKELSELGLAVNKPTGAFYIIANFKEMLQIPMTKKVDENLQLIEKTDSEYPYLKRDSHILMHLLAHYSLLFAALSSFGADASEGNLRITCNADLDELTELITRIERAVYHALLFKIMAMISFNEASLSSLPAASVPEKLKTTLLTVTKLIANHQKQGEIFERIIQLDQTDSLKNLRDCLERPKESQQRQNITFFRTIDPITKEEDKSELGLIHGS